MNGNLMVEERKAYFRYFRVWIILAAVALGVYIFLAVTQRKEEPVVVERNNFRAPAERVFDTADVLSDQEEQHLREVIAECERTGTCDIILVTLNQEMGLTDSTWEHNMMNYADDFYDNAAYGYDKPHGDGALLLDNWYEDERGSQKGSWLSTSGKMEYIIGSYEEGKVFDAMDSYISSNPAKAYEAAIRKIAYWGDDSRKEGRGPAIPLWCGPAAAFVIALIYGLVCANQEVGKDTTTPMTYVPAKPRILRQNDLFTRKTVSKTKIETQSSGSRSGGGGSYGHHSSSGGHSHGGGGRRR